MTPIFKERQKSLVQHYRSVSVLCAMSKMLEREMCNRLKHYLDMYSIAFLMYKPADHVINMKWVRHIHVVYNNIILCTSQYGL